MLRHRRARSGVHVHDPESRLDLHERRLGTVIGARVNVALDAGAGEGGRERPDVYVHSAAVAGARLRERGRVHRKHGDPADGHPPDRS